MFEDDLDTEIGDYFRTNLLETREAIQHHEFRKFGTLNSNAEKIAFVLSYPEAHTLSVDAGGIALKDSEKARKLKDAGNKFFGAGEFTKALEIYSNAALLAPKEELGVILANRAATLYHLERYEHALIDIEECVRLGYPTELMYKVEERRARCHLGLKNHSKAVESFRATLNALDNCKLPIDKKKKLEGDIRLMLAVMDKGAELNKSVKNMSLSNKVKSNENQLPKLEKRNLLFPAFSSSITINTGDSDRGRYAVATKDIQPGELIAIEKPHCAFLLPEYRLTHCHRCFTRIFVPVPAACYTCNCVAYCSLKCRDLDAAVHIRECSLLPPLWMSNASITCFLALKAVIQRPFEGLLKIKDNLKVTNGTWEVSEKKPHESKDYLSFYSLVTHEDERIVEDIFHRIYMACWLLRLIKNSSYIPVEFKSADEADAKLTEVELFIGELLFHHLQLLQFNSHEISELSKSKFDKTLAKAKSIFIGGGIYPTMALLNHSCNPGIVRYFNGTTMVARAVRTIRAGEEVADNYGPIFTVTPESERKRKMRIQYWFDCNCEACKNHWPLLEEIDPNVLRFKCDTGPSCGNVLPVRTDTNEFMIRCTKCGNSTNILKGLKALQDTDQLFKVASQHLEDGQPTKALKSYLEILKLLDENLALPIRDYHLCQQGVRLCTLTLGNVSQI